MKTKSDNPGKGRRVGPGTSSSSSLTGELLGAADSQVPPDLPDQNWLLVLQVIHLNGPSSQMVLLTALWEVTEK